MQLIEYIQLILICLNVHIINCITNQNIDNEGAQRPHYQYFARDSESEPKANWCTFSNILNCFKNKNYSMW